MPDSFIQLPADSTGKQLDTVSVNMGAGSTSVHREKVVLSDPASTSGFATVTSSAGVLASLSSGTVSLSSQISVTATAGTNPWSSAPGFNIPTVSVSSGLVQLSSQITVTATGPVTITSGVVSLSSGTVTLSSNPTVISASSGLVQISGIPTVGISSTSPSIGKFVVATTISKVTSSATTLWALNGTTTAATGALIRLYNTTTDLVVMNTGIVAAILVDAQLGTAVTPNSQVRFGPRGLSFATACSFDVVISATSTAAVLGGPAYVTAIVD